MTDTTSSPVPTPGTTTPVTATTATTTPDAIGSSRTVDGSSTPRSSTSSVRPSLLNRLGGVALGLAPVLFVAGAHTSPPQDSGSNTDYVASLARDPFQTALSANLFHYSWVLFAVGVLAVTVLPTTRRGRGLTTVVATLTSLASVQLSGLLLSDFYASRMSEQNGVADAVAVEFDLGSSVDVWLASGQLAALLLPALFLALARARVVSWWVAPLPLLGLALMAMPFLPAPLTTVLALATWAPAYLAAAQLVTGRRRA